MKKALLLVIFLITSLVGGLANAVGDGALIYGGAGQGKVIFDGKLHASRGLVCNDCHLTTFGTKKKALITMDDHTSGKQCFVCHDGKKVFSDCEQCHRKF